MTSLTRRNFLAGTAAAAATLASPLRAFAAGSSFKIGVISDEISQDFDHACYVIAKDLGLHYVELREIWGKNLQVVSDAQIAEAQKILAKYSLQVTDISSPLYKVNWPGAPVSQYGSKEDLHGAAETTFKQQDEVLERSISLAKQFKTNKVRCFDFWRIDDVKPYRKAIDAKLQESAEKCAQQNIMLVLENEFACNTATGRESGTTLAGVSAKNFALNWDPGNAVMRGELDAFPNGWNAIPKERIHHCHVKNAVKDATGKIVWSPVDIGYVDWAAQFRAMKKIGYSDAVNLETHWKGGGTPEASTRTSWAGMKKNLQQADAI
ncbi:sugar phosphate isomerase/epimerase family protein [Granulicella tundricola]|uniref:Xylose isomerase domain-containing protein TIM barrel n=1 Tax=Granulicella tundricola (strain ATCC BAA-1859 / DSM 23138 / MP5ACTX9) TaxID=1198114 RepID=E8X5T8_GRATM|nr:sugar phosphate isomerase/epimerase family protein [Granulicella tundricola]ADW70822.1 Xylose isomerase domain-containing protein TIM barrel [Granulicella tundricola MP5ACTX9]